MSGIKRSSEDKDPDYEDISVVHQNKRHKAAETTARDATILKIESIIKEQFVTELKNKEHEVEVIDQRLNEARRMMDKLRACIVANYYASAALNKNQEGPSSYDATVLNHPSIKKFLESPSRASSPANQRSETPSVANSETDSVYTHNEDKDGSLDAKGPAANKALRPEGNTVKDPSINENTERQVSRTEDGPRRFVKKTIVVGNVSKYIPPDKREENDQSTHKWMVYVRGSRKEPSIDHFVKKVWFFLHPSYKPNDLVEVSEPPFHLTRRGWGEFPVRVQIHFKDSQNKRIDIIHNLKLDRTYTGLQTLGAETVVEVEIYRHSLGEDFLGSQSFNECAQSEASLLSHVKSSSPHKVAHESADKEPSYYPQPSSLERTPTKVAQRLSFGIPGSTAFQPITASCKIVPQGQAASLAESPGKSFQPITMSCKIVSGSPTSKHSSTSQGASGTKSPVPKLHGTSFTPQNIKQEDSMFAAMPPLCPIGSQPKAQSPKTVTGGLGAFTKVIIKQEPTEPTQQLQEAPSTSQPPLQQIVTVKGNHMVAVSPQKNLATSEGSKVVGIPVGTTVQAAIKPSVTISGGQILVAKSSSSIAKAVGSKQIVAQGVAKAVVSSGSGNVVAQSSQSVSKAQVTSAVAQKAGSQGSVMATLQLPASNIPNLANLPPGTKLYLTTNSKNPSGKGKLLLIPQGAILRAANTASLQSGASSSGGSSTASTTSGLPQHLTYTSYILKQTPQGTFLVGQQSQQASGKQAAANVIVQGNVATSAQGHQTLKLTTGPKGTLVAQTHSASAAVAKISDGAVTSVQSQTQKPGTTLLRVAGGVITASSASLPSVSTNVSTQQAADVSSTSTTQVSASNKSISQQVMARIAHVKSLGTVKPATSAAAVSSTRTAPTLAQSSAASAVKMEPDMTSNASSTSGPGSSTPVKTEESGESDPSSVRVVGQVECASLRARHNWTEHLQNFKQLLTAIVKKVPLLAEKSEDGNAFCATSVEQYYSWNIGKRRASEWQRAVTMKKMLQEIIEKQPKFSNVAPLKTKQIVHWCRIHGYTPPDPESLGSDKESIEDVLARIDNEAALQTSFSAPDILCQKMEELEKTFKKETEEDVDVDVLSANEEQRLHIKKESEAEEDAKLYMVTSPACEFIRDKAQEIGVSVQPVEVQDNIYTSAVEEMILKATEQFVSDVLRDALGVAYQMTSHNRAPQEITVSNIHQAICNIPMFDFLTNKHMASSTTEDEQSLK
ncbi:YEATS domain-containing protein 2 [Xenopus tropicalis]|uniref:YEATS domain-containing protein 2 n=1 Tax=Xenopus tropicalis TaxID=8364 RepID=A9UMH9_XENTR|nr:YEATS domain-containing protein 2 [Xenopus tropicalis]AAI57665.1 LOC100135359 protein [Xenopus tropicalis]|eukprot:NP_001107505.1 YEATS domain-containing protein 2 [Xenopus tropicalis]